MGSKSNSAWKKLSVVLALWLTAASIASASPIIGGTRLVYDGAKHEGSISVRNSDKTPYLIQSWTDAKGQAKDKTNAPKPPFIVTPPLFRMEANSSNQLRVIRTGGNLPEDRESVYWMNVKAIPPSEKGAKNTLQFAISTRIKLFYRPAGLPTIDDKTWQGVLFERQGNQLLVSNPTPFHLTFSRLKVGTTEVDTTNVMVPPKGSARYNLSPAAKGKVTWSLINDYGGASTPLTMILSDGVK